MKNCFLVLLLCSQLISLSKSLAADCFNPKKQSYSELKSGDEVMYFQSGFKRAGTVVNISSNNKNENIYAVHELNYNARGNVVTFNYDTGKYESASGIWNINTEEGIYKRTGCVVVEKKKYIEGDYVSIRRGKGPKSHKLRILKVFENGTALVGMNYDDDIYDEYQLKGESLFDQEMYALYVVYLD